jgi:antitoxin (DNA-binding transcriptional repressor) of toxin-antitoxin stability system
MPTFTVAEAKANLSLLIDQACRGEEIIIKGRKCSARLVPIEAYTGKRRPGALQGKLKIGPNFLDPLPPDELGE